jgi:cation:H+ antiporter
VDSGTSLLTVGQAVLGLALLYVGGEALVRGASALALRLGLSPLAVGLTVVAFATSAPELVVCVDAALSGANDIAVGNVVGSNISNVGLILGLAALVRPAAVEAKVVKLDAPLMIAACGVLALVLADGRVSRLEGALLLTGLVGYVAFTFWQARRESGRVQAAAGAVLGPGRRSGVAASVLLALAGLALLVAGGHVLVAAAVALATAFGVSQATIGLTVVAVGTSLPELATSLVASAKGEGDIAVGNVVGSNLFNVLGIAGTTALVHPLGRGALTGLDLGVMVGLAAALPVLLYTRLDLARAEGATLLAVYVGYVVWLLASG